MAWLPPRGRKGVSVGLWIATHIRTESSGWDAWVWKRLGCVFPSLHVPPSPLQAPRGASTCLFSLISAQSYRYPTRTAIASQAQKIHSRENLRNLARLSFAHEKNRAHRGSYMPSSEEAALVPGSEAASLLPSASSPSRPHSCLVPSARLLAMLVTDGFGGI